ncbi:MAG: hypothetical protein MI757_02545 [Pirellulales bacterium]|nr:hypothetical protein [Pirellulales bacterium]
MQEILFHYQKVNPTTWVYLSSLLMIGIFFKFNRLWSIRNVDLIGIILLAPGLLMVVPQWEVHDPQLVARIGYLWLFSVSALFMLRLMLDWKMVRRPLLEPNLNVGGMTFIGCSLLVFLMVNVIVSKTPGPNEQITRYSPLYPLIYKSVSIPSETLTDTDDDPDEKQSETAQTTRRAEIDRATSKTIAILSHIAVVIGIVVIGYRHFDNIRTGIATATLYLMLPYTALLTGRIDHVLPAALLVWAVQCYRRPMVAGTVLGVAIGLIYYPVFLLPLWCAFYWHRGLLRFLLGVGLPLLIMFAILVFSGRTDVFIADMIEIFNWNVREGDGFWSTGLIGAAYRIPVMAAFFAMAGSFALWPAEKNLGTLMSCSAVIMIGVQFWVPVGGGQFMAWFLPLMLLTIFRPNLEDRVAPSVLGEGWLMRRRLNGSRAA